MFEQCRATWYLLFVALVCLPRDASAGAPPSDDLILWLDAGELVGDTDSDLPESGSKIALWKDKSSRGNHVAQDRADRQPTFVRHAMSDRPAVRFHANELLDQPKFSGLATGDQRFHVLIVMQAPGDSSLPAQRLIELGSRDPGAAESAPRRGFWVGYQAGRKKVRLGITDGDEGEGQRVAWDGAPHVVEAVYTGEQTFAIYVDGSRQQRAMFNGTHFLGFQRQITLAIGQHFGGEESAGTYYQGDIAELFIYRRPLTATERFEIGNYLTEKYKLNAEFRPIPHFETGVFPILAQHCQRCHGGETREEELDLRSVSAMLRGGKAGPVIVRGFPDRSALISRIETGEMPPEDAQKLNENELRILRDWVEADAPSAERITVATATSTITAADRDHWAYRKPLRDEPPAVRESARVTNDVDRFILAKLEQQGLEFSQEADRATLIRRLYFDLIGLPPPISEIETLVNDHQEGAYERLIDRLLASQHFGERWGRYWLDVAGYVDVWGSDNDAAIIKPLEGKWRYRDYVIRSLNQDKPFDQFLVEQLAGDELYDWRSSDKLTPEMLEALTATSFLLCANDDTDQNELNTPDIRHHVLQRTAEVVASNLLAMTLMCAKCHDHKYEAISQYDYYSWEAVFAPAFNVRHWIIATAKGRADVSDKDKAEIDGINADVDAQVRKLNQRVAGIRGGYRQELFAAKLTQLPKTVRLRARDAVNTPADKRDPEQIKLVTRFGPKLTVKPEEIDTLLREQHKSELAEIAVRIRQQNSRRRSYGTIQVVYEPNPIPPTYVLRRGNYLRPGLEVRPALLSILRDDLAENHQPARPAGASSGRRLALARRLTDSESLAGQYVARVIVNRIWQQVFGRGIVETSDNFGVSGTLPTHSRLLDWLTLEFIDNGWRSKPLIKLMLMSSTYRQDSSMADDVDKAEQIDPSNNLLWRMRLRRLDSEMVRDAILATSGKLNRDFGGPPLALNVRPDGMVLIKEDGLPTPASKWRRSIYVLARRNYHLTMLRVFDQPIVARNCTVRKPAPVVTQSLMLLHDDFVLRQASFFAEHVLSKGTNAATPIATAFLAALGRQPDDEESAWCNEFLARHLERYQKQDIPEEQAQKKALAHLCHMLFNTSEFLYVR